MENGVFERRDLLNGPRLKYLAQIVVARLGRLGCPHMIELLLDQLSQLGIDLSTRAGEVVGVSKLLFTASAQWKQGLRIEVDPPGPASILLGILLSTVTPRR